MDFKRFRRGRRESIVGTLAATLAVLLLAGGPACAPPSVPGGGGGGNNNDNSSNSNDNGSNNGGNNNSNSNGGPTGDIQALRVVPTNAQVDSGGEARAGDDIIAIGTGQGSGVQYLIPSRGDVDPIDMTAFESFVPAGFGVAGNWVIMRNFDGEVFLFDGNTEQLTSVPEADLALFSGAAPPGFPEFWADGDYIVTVADGNRVADGLRIKMIDVGADPPTITSFVDPPVEPVQFRENEKWHMAIDTANRQFVALVTDFVVIYDMDDPTAQPAVIDTSAVGGVSNRDQTHLDDGFLIYHAHELSGNNRELTYMLDLEMSITTLIDENPSRPRPMDLESGIFGYFAHVSDADVSTNDTARSVFGTVASGAPEMTQLNDARTALGADPEDGIVGYGCTIAITPDGRYRFVAGCGNVGVAEYLFISTGGPLEVLADQLDLDFLGLGTPASCVDASNTLAVFRTSQSVAYIELP